MPKPFTFIRKEEPTQRIAVIGGGPAAVSFCWQLFTRLQSQPINSPLEILIFEKGNEVGPGCPYAQEDPSYILNLPKERMEPIEGKTGDFSGWLGDRCTNTQFPPRYLFGQYLKYLVKKLEEEAKAYPIQIRCLTNTIVSNLCIETKKFLLQDSTGAGYWADYVVLCTGHMASETYLEYQDYPDYWHNPWDREAFLSVESDASVGILGTRLTAIDIAMKLISRKHRGAIWMASRSGLLPAVLAESIPPYSLKYLQLNSFSGPISLSYLIQQLFKEISVAQGKPCSFDSIVTSYHDITPAAWLDKEIKQSETGPRPWQQILFSLYPLVPKLWPRISLSDQHQFMHQYYSTFMTYLAAFPLKNAYKLRDLLQSGQLHILGGLQGIKHQAGHYLLQGENGCSKTKYLFNATGHGHNLAYEPLYSKLFQQGLIDQCPLGGLNVHRETLQVLTPKGQPISGLFALGELTRGTFLATADMTRVATQANQVSTVISQTINQNGICRHPIRKPIPCFFPIRKFSTFPLATLAIQGLKFR